MLNLSDINAATNSYDGSTFSDLFKDVYGYRPRGTLAQFNTIEEFDAEYERLSNRLSIQLDEEAERQARNFSEFVARVQDTMELVVGIDRVRAIEIIADADGELEDMKFYGYERLEWSYDLKYGSIKQWLIADHSSRY
jgi:hypothetical protein